MYGWKFGCIFTTRFVLKFLCNYLKPFIVYVTQINHPQSPSSQILIVNYVFLFPETQNFVELLFKRLETQKFDTAASIKQESDTSKTPPAMIPQTPLEQPAEPNNSTTVNSNATPAMQINGTVPPLNIKREPRKSDSEKDDKEREKRPRSR